MYTTEKPGLSSRKNTLYQQLTRLFVDSLPHYTFFMVMNEIGHLLSAIYSLLFLLSQNMARVRIKHLLTLTQFEVVVVTISICVSVLMCHSGGSFHRDYTDEYLEQSCKITLSVEGDNEQIQ